MKNRGEINVTKYSGEKAPFDVEKLRQSLQRSGAKEKVIDAVVEQVLPILYEGISTKEIYKKAFALLRKKERPAAARYNLKKALLQLGPTGFPFELYVAELLKAKGYETRTGQIVQGNCVQHEVDVIA
ncbi:MAG TPA: ATPase, partial [Cryomorphaceae bacterium]|nr:ATPase [Cryomorphaceae bacterium]